MKVLYSAVFILSFFIGQSQVNFSKEAFRLYDSKGKLVTYEILYNQCLEADIILFGELHNNPIAHWLQFELSKDLLNDTSKKLVFGAEMFETHQQLYLDEYLTGVIDFKSLKDETKLWPNFKTDYKPLVDLAKENNIAFIATNSPRDFARNVARKGIDSLNATLTDSSKSLLVPLPFEINFKAPGYKELMESDFGAGHGVNTKFMVQAQALKDATMAYFILKDFDPLGQRFIHFNGDFHSKNQGGIYWYLKAANKKLKILVISTTESNNLEFENEWKKQGDFLLVIPSSMTKTY